jgi:predicted RecA/RadA family phage recombinase
VKTFIQAGSNLTIPAPAAVTSGGVVIAGQIVGIAAGSAAINESVDVVVTGVFELPKVGADAFTLGELVYWNSTTKLATETSSGNTKLGVAVAAAAASTGTVKVRLSGF